MTSATHPYYAGIEKALLADSDDPNAAVLASNRLYADQMPDDPLLPGVRYALLADRPDQRLSGGDSTTADIQIDIYVQRGDFGRAWAVDRHVRKALDRQSLTVDGFADVQCMCVQRGRPLAEPGFYRITSTYRLFGSAA